MARKSRIDGLLERQAEELAQLEQENVAAVLQAYDDARRSLHERLRVITPGATPETEHRLRVMLAQAEQGVVELQSRLGVVMSAAERKAHKQAMAHLLGLVKAQEPDFTDSGGLVEVGVVRRLAGLQALALHRFSVARYGAQVIDAVQRELVAGVVQGMTVQQLADRVAAAGGSVFAGLRGRAMLIARMETARAYNDAHLEGIRELDDQDPDPADPWLKKVDEFFDRRNHPFSRAVNDRVARPRDPFVVPVADVQAAATAMGRPVSGVLWAQVDGVYHGQNLPAHFNERGRIVAWRASWGPSKASPPPPVGTAAQPPQADPWVKAKGRLDEVTKRVQDAGLDPERVGLSKVLRDDIRQAGGASLALMQMASPRYAMRRNLVKWAADLQSLGHADLATRVQAELDLHDELTVAYREAVVAAPPEWAEAERSAWAEKLLAGETPAYWTKKEREQLAKNWDDALAVYSADILRILVIEGERLEHDGVNKRAYASSTATEPGKIVMNLTPLRDDVPPTHEISTPAHEWGHRLDGVFSHNGQVGQPWAARPGYPDLPNLWKSTYRDPFDAAKSGGVELMPYETAARYRWSGSFVDQYESRIYSPGPAKPSPAFLAGSYGTGPIEFISQAVTYHVEHTAGWRNLLRSLAPDEYSEATVSKKRMPAPLAGQPGVFGRLMGYAFSPVRTHMRRLRTGRELYGDGWTDGLERLYGGGERFLREIAAMPDVKWQGDNDVLLTALAFRDRYGVPLERSVGRAGALRPKLTRDLSSDELRRLESLLPARDATADEQREAWERAARQLTGGGP